MTAELFSGLYEDGLPRTVRFLLSLGFPRDVVSEIAQAAWSRAWELQNQLRDETKLLGWVNAIALNDARKAVRRGNRHVSFGPMFERVTTMNVAAIDVAAILDRCSPKDREILEAQLEGTSNSELAGQQGVSEPAMRLRAFRARRAARNLCDAPPVADAAIDARIEELSQTLQEQCLTLAQQSLKTAETCLRLLEAASEKERQEKLRRYIKKGIDNARRSLSRVPTSRPEVAACHRIAMDLRKRMLRDDRIHRAKGEALRPASVA